MIVGEKEKSNVMSMADGRLQIREHVSHMYIITSQLHMYVHTDCMYCMYVHNILVHGSRLVSC